MLKSFAIVVFVVFAAGIAATAQDVRAAQESDVADSGKAAVAYAARLVGDKNRARLIVDFDAEVKYKLSVIRDPMRIVINLSRTVFNLNDDATDLPASIVGSLRYGVIDPRTSRIVLALDSPALINSGKLKKLDEKGRHRLIVDLVSVDAEKFEENALEEAETLPVAKTERPKPVKKPPTKNTPKRKFVIVLDPGHGGIDGGAAGKKRVEEKDVTLDFAIKLAARLRENENYDVLTTRSDDSFVSLPQRLNMARHEKAHLFISIHADSLRQRNIRGATIYTLSKKGSDSLARSLARKQNRTDLIAGLALPELDAPVSDILIDLTRRETKSFSNRFAHSVVQSMRKGVRLIRNPLRSADFYVLKAPEVPSVLLELGYLSNSRDEALLSSKQWQQMVADRVALAIGDFFATRLAAKP